MNNIAFITKEFRWEMGHRLPFHNGLCKNIHGHSYRMLVKLEGELDSNGFVIDYFDLKLIVQPIIDTLDHSFLCSADDTLLSNFLSINNLKHSVVDFNTTAENIALWLAEQIKNKLLIFKNLSTLEVTVFETVTASAVRKIEL